ncbi:hypothetical protein JAAARDRAFT_613482 [Jaapia argillacea MUCL 33604]|uniref:Creatinase N-terminal domain-containing protein n=1 Tax=Jaapia argillacea MUCL 33604 TaxID=933084 RepID=A0A067P810_9AGAM|nr:hypothetical protein JAAARDRAFT_613482 [Jaapia argillacea MUCL 33604]
MAESIAPKPTKAEIRVRQSEDLAQLRKEMEEHQLDWYLVMNETPHGQVELMDFEKCLFHICGEGGGVDQALGLVPHKGNPHLFITREKDDKPPDVPDYWLVRNNVADLLKECEEQMTKGQRAGLSSNTPYIRMRRIVTMLYYRAGVETVAPTLKWINISPEIPRGMCLSVPETSHAEVIGRSERIDRLQRRLKELSRAGEFISSLATIAYLLFLDETKLEWRARLFVGQDKCILFTNVDEDFKQKNPTITRHFGELQLKLSPYDAAVSYLARLSVKPYSVRLFASCSMPSHRRCHRFISPSKTACKQ